jgi:hypothetical protein
MLEVVSDDDGDLVSAAVGSSLRLRQSATGWQREPWGFGSHFASSEILAI